MNLQRKIATIQKQIDSVDSNGEVADLDHWRARNEVALRTTLGADNPTYNHLIKVTFSPGMAWSGMSNDYYVQARRGGIKQSVALMKAAIGEIELVDGISVDEGGATAPGGTRVFIVHGHDNARRLEVSTLVRDLTAVKPTILIDYPNQGDTVIENLERAASEAAYAIIVASGDDVGSTKNASDEPRPRARQNVIFELGYFIGKLGRSRVALLVEPGVERPSDTDGILYISLDPNGGWKLPLAKELNNAGMTVDFNALAG
ncbi:nucleotide-binding protein [Nocardia cyriacigeorgica]|uniref:nucleotide-binding protein n=1 Tax=Nocardia cyriacigeorgica TaxID=135487 RepID=UPI002457C154|nr:nucleotide-binding protein [Nocardia cyriacigeorgica]